MASRPATPHGPVFASDSRWSLGLPPLLPGAASVSNSGPSTPSPSGASRKRKFAIDDNDVTAQASVSPIPGIGVATEAASTLASFGAPSSGPVMWSPSQPRPPVPALDLGEFDFDTDSLLGPDLPSPKLLARPAKRHKPLAPAPPSLAPAPPPLFGDLFPVASQPAAEPTEETCTIQ
mgnify:CR=1 FL=1